MNNRWAKRGLKILLINMDEYDSTLEGKIIVLQMDDLCFYLQDCFGNNVKAFHVQAQPCLIASEMSKTYMHSVRLKNYKELKSWVFSKLYCFLNSKEKEKIFIFSGMRNYLLTQLGQGKTSEICFLLRAFALSLCFSRGKIPLTLTYFGHSLFYGLFCQCVLCYLPRLQVQGPTVILQIPFSILFVLFSTQYQITQQLFLILLNVCACVWVCACMRVRTCQPNIFSMHYPRPGSVMLHSKSSDSAHFTQCHAYLVTKSI